MKLLLISNSTNAGEPYLQHCIGNIGDFLGTKKKSVFIPFAAVTFSFDEYEKKVAEKFAEIGQEIVSVHRFDDYKQAVENAEAIVVGGGNTWALLKRMQENDLLDVIRKKVVDEGVPYIGWSAGSNVACPTIKTTNDMPIVEPDNFNALNFVNFQINPHYLDANPEGHAGETREQRIEEFIEMNKDVFVVGLREGTMLRIEDGNIKMIGKRNARIFRFGSEPKELSVDDDFSFLLK